MLRCWNSGRLTLLLGQLAGLCLLDLGDASHGFRSQQATSPVTTDLVVTFIVVGLDGFDKLGQVCAVSVLDVLQSDGGAGLAVDEASQARLALDDAVWDSHLAAQGWQEQDQLKDNSLIRNIVQKSIPLRIFENNQAVMFLTRCERCRENPGISRTALQVKKFFSSIRRP